MRAVLGLLRATNTPAAGGGTGKQKHRVFSKHVSSVHSRIIPGPYIFFKNTLCGHIRQGEVRQPRQGSGGSPACSGCSLQCQTLTFSSPGHRASRATSCTGEPHKVWGHHGDSHCLVGVTPARAHSRERLSCAPGSSHLLRTESIRLL